MSDEVVKRLDRANELLTALASAALGPVLEVELKDPKSAELYRRTGGELSVDALARKIGISVGTISHKWQRWERLGLLTKSKNRYRKVLQ